MFGFKLRTIRSGPALFEKLHGFPAGKPREISIPQPKGHVVDVYRVDEIHGTKVLDEGFGKHAVGFRHPFAAHAAPRLVADATGRGFLIGGNYKITGHGIEDNPMAHRYRFYNPSMMGTVGGVVALSAGLVLGAGVLAGIQAIPASRLGDNWKDGIAVGVGALVAWSASSSMGAARLISAGAGVALIGGTVNRRWDVTGKVTSKVHEWMASMWDRMLPAASGTPALPPPADVPPVHQGVRSGAVPAQGYPMRGNAYG